MHPSYLVGGRDQLQVTVDPPVKMSKVRFGPDDSQQSIAVEVEIIRFCDGGAKVYVWGLGKGGMSV